MILYPKTLKRCFWDHTPWKTRLCHSIISILTFPKNSQPSFVLGAIGSFSFPTPMSIYIWSISLLTPDNIEMSLTTWISLMPISANWLYRCFTYLGGSFIQLTTHAFFILNIAKFKFGKMYKLTKLDWILFSLDITLDKEIFWYKLIILWKLNRQAKIFLCKSLGLFLYDTAALLYRL